jgi:hypothetical protein
MIFKTILIKMYLWFFDDTVSLLSRNITNDKQYLEELYKSNQKELKCSDSYLLRSFLQYKCQMYKISHWKRVVLALFSPFFMVLFIPYTLLFGCFLTKSDYCEKNGIVNGDIDEDLIPESLLEQYDLVKCQDNFRFILRFSDLRWLMRKTCKYFLHPYFLFKLTVKIAQYSYLITRYCPEVIVTTSEYSFCSSTLTDFCITKGVEHFNIMHGEKGFNIRDSFFQFSRCYVWEDYYVGLFQSLKADVDQFIIESPPKHKKIIALGTTSKSINNKIKFYWASEYKEDELRFISKHLRRIKKLGFDIEVRYHPLHEEDFYKQIFPFFRDLKIENPKQISLYDSLVETEYVLGTYTTVLYEGYLMNRKLIINDYNYSLLLGMSCISVHLPHSKLSEFKGS